MFTNLIKHPNLSLQASLNWIGSFRGLCVHLYAMEILLKYSPDTRRVKIKQNPFRLGFLQTDESNKIKNGNRKITRLNTKIFTDGLPTLNNSPFTASKNISYLIEAPHSHPFWIVFYFTYWLWEAAAEVTVIHYPCLMSMRWPPVTSTLLYSKFLLAMNHVLDNFV